jgi:hypothetical protein
MISPKYYQINNKFFASITESKHVYDFWVLNLAELRNVSTYRFIKMTLIQI